MERNKILQINGAVLEKHQLEKHLENIALEHNLKEKSDKQTYPVPRMMENYEIIRQIYNLLNRHLKQDINIHPAGEWLLDNFYIIEETVKLIKKELTLKKYKNFVGLKTGIYKGFARAYVLAAEIVAYTDNKINRENLEEYLKSYQNKKYLNMEEIWNIGMFMQIAIIENIRKICEKIYSSQMQKYKAKQIIEKYFASNINQKENLKVEIKDTVKINAIDNNKYPFIEYMSYELKKYGKKSYSYVQVLEEMVERSGMTVSEAIRKEHFDMAVRKVSIGNSILSIKAIQRINFSEIFETVNGVEDLFRKDPAGIYENMDYKTKEYYRSEIKEIGAKSKISEIYIAQKLIKLASKGKEGTKQNHIGYYLIDEGKKLLYQELGFKYKTISNQNKMKIYILSISFFSVAISFLIATTLKANANLNLGSTIIGTGILIIPISEIIIQIVNYILGKVIKPKLIPKMNFTDGIEKKNATMVVIPTIIKSKEKVKELFSKAEVYYLANKSPNLYFTILGDCTQSSKEKEKFDKEIIEEGKRQVEQLNDKYAKEGKNIFNFVYRKREWNKHENSFLGWERKRGYLNRFNKFLLGQNVKDFEVNTIEEDKIPRIKYIITLDSDTDLVLNSAFELVGAMAHTLNNPIIDEKKNIVVEGYGIIQPRVGIKLEVSYKNLFTKIFASQGGTDLYANAISDIYQDNFGEGIFTGKGIYNLEVFEKVLSDVIPENKVLSHDLLEGSYLRCGLATDIFLMDDYPTKYMTYINRLSRWIRGDWQIADWLNGKIKNSKNEAIKNPLSTVSKYKILDNLRRSLFEIISLIALFYFRKNALIQILLLFIIVIPYILDLINYIIFKKEGEKHQKTFARKISCTKGAIYRGIIAIGTLPYKAYISILSILKALYRGKVSHKNMLEWTTSEEAEKQAKTDVVSYYKAMSINVILGVGILIIGVLQKSILELTIGTLWILTPFIMYYISKAQNSNAIKEKLNKQEQEYIIEVAQKTWEYFKENLNQENNYLIPDNYQEDRIPKLVARTSSTNIGLSLLAVISAIDLKFIKEQEGIQLLEKIIETISNLQKWKGHLYNWYNTKTKEPLIPRYVSTVDSGNFIGYLYVTKSFIRSLSDEYKQLKQNLIELIEKIIKETDFKVLYNNQQRLFSIGFNIEENRLTDSYYDLLASEARQASLVAIAKKDIEAKHWSSLSRTMTYLNGYKGLISWSGTAFEYLMPNINIPTFEGSLLDESCKFMIMCQLEYAKKLGIPWGISESAFSLRDLQSNYQYKAFGIPWLGLKRGLADEMVITSYGSILAINYIPKEVIKNLKQLEKEGMYSKYGFYEAIDYTPDRLSKGQTSKLVKTYMAHHQALALLSINNLINNQIFQKRFMQNPEIEGTKVLLQERIPDTFITTKDKKEKIDKIKYKDYENYTEQVINKIDNRIVRGNVISNEHYTVAINQKGQGFSKYKDLYINRFKKTSDENQGIFFYIKNIKTNKIWSTNYTKETDKYSISFMPDKTKQEQEVDGIKTIMKITVASSSAVEIRRLKIENTTNEEQTLEVVSYLEPVLSTKEQDYAHQAFNNLFLTSEYNEESKSLIVKRRSRGPEHKRIYLAVRMSTNSEIIGDIEYETDKERFIGRGNLEIPNMIKQSFPFSKKVGISTEPIIAIKKIIKIQPNQEIYVDLVLSVGEDKEIVTKQLEDYQAENIERAFNISRARCEAESRYLRIKGKEIELYQKILSYILFENPLKSKQVRKLPHQNYIQSDLWKYGISGDLPIILVTISDVNDIYVVKQILKAYEFFRTKNVRVEIVILNEEKYNYEGYTKEEIEKEIANSGIAYMKNIKGGIFVLNEDEVNEKDINTIKFIATLKLDAHQGKLENAIKDMEEEYLDTIKNIGEKVESKIINTENNVKDDINILEDSSNLKYYNEYGAFSEDGKEYLISFNKNNRLPTVWSNILANEKFGTVVTENMGGYSWYKNSRLNRVSTWNNSAVMDVPSEIIYMRDEETGKVWSLGANPSPDENNYNVIYGFGYAKYIHKSIKVVQELEVFVPKEDSCKIGILKLKNTEPIKKKLELIYYIKPVIGEDEIKSDTHINVEYEIANNIVKASNLYNLEFGNQVVYVSSSEKIKSYTGDKKFFIGDGSLVRPDGIRKVALNNESGLGKESCIAIQIDIDLESFESKEIVLILGATDENDYRETSYKYKKIQNCYAELEKIKRHWKELLEKLQVYTPLESMNIMLNGWIMYQTISSRLLGRSGFYQSGGAFGFRDQLQDTIGAKYLSTEIMKKQIIKHSQHQFIEGDVEHWWHDETGRGIRTRFSDDLLWLVFLCIEYISFTGDYSILKIETPYLQGEILKENEEERYDKYEIGEIKETILEHCIRAIDRTCSNFGEHELPLIGTGDWNDGLSNVGNRGRGESVWLGFFLYYILDNFIKICKNQEFNNEKKLEEYSRVKEKLKRVLNTTAWDGRWYKRAFCDDGNWLGTIENEECKIDSIAQSWSVISNAGDNDKKYISMESLENHLVDRENGIIKLLDPPFEKSKLEPGYIKAYLAGVRENGGQYTHGAIWAIIAEAILGFGDKALEYYRMINPIEHARTKEASNKYKVEPYVIAADIYGGMNLAGRGGWTWYTGSSSWYYEAGIEYILGLKIRKGILSIEPCIPSNWKEYLIRYKYGKSIYNIRISNPNGKNTGVEKFVVNGVEIKEKSIKLDNNGGIVDIEVVM